MSLFSFNYLLASKAVSLGEQLEDETKALSLSLSKVNFDATPQEVQTKLSAMSKALNELMFIRTELLLAGERKTRRTMTKEEIKAMEEKMLKGTANDDFVQFIGQTTLARLPELPLEWINLLIKAAEVIDNPALDIQKCQSAGKAVVELLALRAKQQKKELN